jgi:plastocyanin
VKRLFLLVATAVVVGGAACGDEGDGDGEGEGAEGATVSLTADAGGLLAYEEKRATAPAGFVTIEFDNPSTWDEGHDVVVETADGKEITRTDVIVEGESDTATAEFKPGTYTYYCSVGGHRGAGMQGTLRVE